MDSNANTKASDSKKIKSVTNLSIIVNIILTAAKFLIGFLAGSLAVISDGVHSFSDMVTDLAVIFGVHYGSKEPDVKHPYGHGRIETLASTFVATALVLVGLGMVYYAAVDITKGSIITPNIAMFVVTISSIVSKEWLYQVTRKVAIKTHSSAAYANAWHHRSDAMSSVAVLIGIVALKFGFAYGDQIAAIAVGLMIILIGLSIIGDCLREFAEGAVDPKTAEHITNIINAHPSIRQWHKLRTHTVGREVFVDLHILVDPNISISAAHDISEKLETALQNHLARPVTIIIHIEPDVPQLRK
jgi:cation diffusion facilitator family transporter